MLINAYNIVGTLVRVAHALLIYCFMFMRMFGQVKKVNVGAYFAYNIPVIDKTALRVWITR